MPLARCTANVGHDEYLIPQSLCAMIIVISNNTYTCVAQEAERQNKCTHIRPETIEICAQIRHNSSGTDSTTLENLGNCWLVAAASH